MAWNNDKTGTWIVKIHINHDLKGHEVRHCCIDYNEDSTIGPFYYMKDAQEWVDNECRTQNKAKDYCFYISNIISPDIPYNPKKRIPIWILRWKYGKHKWFTLGAPASETEGWFR